MLPIIGCHSHVLPFKQAKRCFFVIAQRGLVRILPEGVGMSAHRPDGITAEDWAATPRSVRVLVGALQEQVTGLEQRVRAVAGAGEADLADIVQGAVVGPTAPSLRARDGGATGA